MIATESEPFRSDIAHHAHDLKLFIFRPEIFNKLADRILSGENLFRTFLIDDCDRERAFHIVLVEIPAAHEGDAEGLEVIRRDDSDSGLILFRAPGPIECPAAVPSRKWQPADRGNMFGARHSRDLLQDLL